MTADRQPEAGAAVLPGAAAVDLPELLEHQLLGVLRDADAGVRDRERDHALLVDGTDRDASGFGELDGIAKQVDQDLAKLLLVGAEGRQVGLDLLLEPQPRP